MSVNRTGRPVGARNKLQTCFLNDLLERWEIDGKNAMNLMAKEEPSKFVQVAAALMPREVSMEIGSPLRELTDEQLQHAIEQWRNSAIDVTPVNVSENPNMLPPVKVITSKKKPND
jgi:hypothetical protein